MMCGDDDDDDDDDDDAMASFASPENNNIEVLSKEMDFQRFRGFASPLRLVRCFLDRGAGIRSAFSECLKIKSGPWQREQVGAFGKPGYLEI